MRSTDDTLDAPNDASPAASPAKGSPRGVLTGKAIRGPAGSKTADALAGVVEGIWSEGETDQCSRSLLEAHRRLRLA
jgi:hypothetical protein